MKRNILTALAALSLSAVGLLPAQAQAAFTCDSVPAHVFGNADITPPNGQVDCTITNSVTADGYIHINATGFIDTQALSAQREIKATTGGDISVHGALTVSSTAFPLWLKTSGGKILVTGDITTAGGGVGLTAGQNQEEQPAETQERLHLIRLAVVSVWCSVRPPTPVPSR
jgi:hypothetical protein